MTTPTLDRPSRLIFKRWPQDPDELHLFTEVVFGITVPRQKVCDDHTSPFDALAEAFFATAPVSVWHGSRGFGGKSFSLALLSVLEATILSADVTILGGSGAQSMRVYEHMLSLWHGPYAPRETLDGEPTRYVTRFRNGNTIVALMASQASVRGPHPQRLRMDEIDEMDLAIFEAAQGQPMHNPRRPGVATQTVASSTWQYPDRCVTGDTAIVTRRGELPIQQVRVGDYAMTRQGWRQVEDVVYCGLKPHVEVEFASGAIVRCSARHKFWTDLGWVEAASLDPGTVGTRLSVAAHPTQTRTVGESGVGQGQVVPVVADRLRHLDPQGPVVVDPRGDRLQVTGVHAQLHPAHMVQVQSVGDRAHHLGPHPAVRQPHLAAALAGSDRLVPVPGHRVGGERPQDAVVGVQVEDVVLQPDQVVSVRHSPMLLPMWDLTVQGTPEYVANSILVHNTMSVVMKRALEKGWPVHSWCWKETSNPTDGWLTADQIERKRAEVSQAMWCVPDDAPILTARGPVPAAAIAVGDLVLTRMGWKPVERKWESATQPVYRVVTDDGSEYRASGAHTVATPGGWARTDSLAPGSVLLAVRPHPLPLTGQAVAVSLPVESKLRVPVGAGVSGMVPVPVGHVLGEGHQAQVGRVHAPLDMTVMVDGYPVGDGPHMVGVRQPVAGRETGDSGGGVPLGGESPLPQPAAAFRHHDPVGEVLGDVGDPWFGSSPVRAGLAAGDSGTGDWAAAVGTVERHVVSIEIQEPVRTWDLQVADAHEFTVNGLILHNSVEYDLQEPSVEGRAFNTDAVERYFDPALGTFAGRLDEDIVLAPPESGARYVTGVDWAKSKDWTIIRTYRTDVSPWQEVAFLRTGRRPWPEMVAALVKRWEEYGGLVWHDATGLGAVVEDYLPSRLRDQRVVTGVQMVGRAREEMFSEYISAVEHDELRTARIDFAYGEHKYATHDDFRSGRTGHPPDSVVAGALAWQARHAADRPTASGLLVEDFEREESPWRTI